MSGKSYLVTGGTGFIGAALVHALLKSGNRIRVLDNQSRGSMRRISAISKEIEIVEADIRDAESVVKATKGIDSVCHLAFVNGTQFFYEKPDLVLDVGVKGMVNVLDACMQNKVPELVVASSSEVYQQSPVVPTDETVALAIPDVTNPRYSYAAGKIISEVMAINYGKHFERVLIFRPHNVYGPDMGWEHVVPQFALRMRDLVNSANSNEPIKFPIQGSGEESRAFVYIDDFTQGLERVIERGEHLGIYHIGTEDECSVKELAELVGKYYERSIQIVPGSLARGGAQRRCPDISKLRKLGYEPQISLADGINQTVKWYDQNLQLAPKQTVSTGRN